jgi:hypothetical protein
MTDTLADQHYRQLPVSTASIRAIMRSAAFVAGVDDVRSGRAPDYDAYCFSLFQWNKEL